MGRAGQRLSVGSVGRAAENLRRSRGGTSKGGQAKTDKAKPEKAKPSKAKKDETNVACGECERWCFLQETPFGSVEEATGKDFRCRICGRMEEVCGSMEEMKT